MPAPPPPGLVSLPSTLVVWVGLGAGHDLQWQWQCVQEGRAPAVSGRAQTDDSGPVGLCHFLLCAGMPANPLPCPLSAPLPNTKWESSTDAMPGLQHSMRSASTRVQDCGMSKATA
jgi:hypothetical protein